MLAAGAGTRLRPLTDVRPKALCTIAGRPLLDLGLARLEPHVGRTAVNAHHHAEQVVAALADRDVTVSREEPEALGTAGALGLLRPWIDGAAVLLTNADACHPGDGGAADVAALVGGWDGERPRLLCTRVAAGVRGDFGDLRYVGTALLPWWSITDREATPSGLYEVSWRDLAAAGRLDLQVAVGEPGWVDCGTPADYLRANMAASRGASVVEQGAVVEGTLVQSVVWAGERVEGGETLVDVVRGAGVTLRPLDTPR